MNVITIAITMYLILAIFNAKTPNYISSNIYSNNVIYVLKLISWFYSQRYVLINLLNNFM